MCSCLVRRPAWSVPRLIAASLCVSAIFAVNTHAAEAPVVKAPESAAPPPTRTVVVPVMTIPIGRACANGTPQGDTVACIHNRAITLGDLDHAGDHGLHDALDQVYRQRMIVLYRLLSDDILAREAKLQHVTVDDLLEREVNSRVANVSDADAESFLKERLATRATETSTEAGADNSPAALDPQRIRQAASYLTLKRRADRKRVYLEGLFKHYDVKVALEPPPPAPAEAIRGPMTPAIGPSSAAVTVVVFSDYLCPYCKSLSHTLEDLRGRYPSDVRIVYRQFPIHPRADRLAEAALCAEEQGQFAAYHKLLFDRTGVSDDELAPLATEAGLDRLAFTACLGSERHRQNVDDDLAEGKRLLIQGTPTLFVNGVRLEGNQTLDSLSARVELVRQAHPTLAASHATTVR